MAVMTNKLRNQLMAGLGAPAAESYLAPAPGSINLVNAEGGVVANGSIENDGKAFFGPVAAGGIVTGAVVRLADGNAYKLMLTHTVLASGMSVTLDVQNVEAIYPRAIEVDPETKRLRELVQAAEESDPEVAYQRAVAEQIHKDRAELATERHELTVGAEALTTDVDVLPGPPAPGTFIPPSLVDRVTLTAETKYDLSDPLGPGKAVAALVQNLTRRAQADHISVHWHTLMMSSSLLMQEDRIVMKAVVAAVRPTPKPEPELGHYQFEYERARLGSGQSFSFNTNFELMT